MRNLFRFHLLLVLFSALSLNAAAQSDHGSLSGRVLDQNGSAVSNANVRLRQKSTTFDRTVTTDGSGSFRFDDLVQSQYDLSVAVSGFSTAT
jgi:hypothetical protein